MADMAWKIPLSDIDLTQEDRDEVNKILDEKWLSMGPRTEALEKDFADYTGARHAFGVANGTAALHLALEAAGIGPGDEVIVPSLTFVATANAVLYCGAEPVFADVTSADDLTISPEDVKGKMTEKTRAIIAMHYAGYPCDMGALGELAAENGLALIEDAAHALGMELDGIKAGELADVSCFSFFANKNIAVGEGGMVTTSNDDVAGLLRKLRSHGMTSLTWDRHQGKSLDYDVVDLGYNYRITELAAALARGQLRRLDANNARRGELTARYRELLAGVENVSVPFAEHRGSPSYHIMPVLLDKSVDAEGVRKAMHESGVQTSHHYPPVHLFTYYRELGCAEGSLPVTEDVAPRQVTLPLHPLMGDEDVDAVVGALKASLDEG